VIACASEPDPEGSVLVTVKTSADASVVRHTARLIKETKQRWTGRPASFISCIAGGDSHRSPAFGQTKLGSGLGDPDHAARKSAAGVADRLRLEVVFLLVHDHTAADD